MARAEKSAVGPELKVWADRVIVPALVKAWLAEHGLEKDLARDAGDVVECAAIERTTAEGVQ